MPARRSTGAASTPLAISAAAIARTLCTNIVPGCPGLIRNMTVAPTRKNALEWPRRENDPAAPARRARGVARRDVPDAHEAGAPPARAQAARAGGLARRAHRRRHVRQGPRHGQDARPGRALPVAAHEEPLRRDAP